MVEMIVNGRKRDVLIAAEIHIDHYQDTIQGDGEKPDQFKACATILEKDFEIGRLPAHGTINIVAQDDAIKALLGNGLNYRIYITDMYESEPTPQTKTEPTLLTDHMPKKDDAAPSEAPPAPAPTEEKPVVPCVGLAEGECKITEGQTYTPDSTEIGLLCNGCPAECPRYQQAKTQGEGVKKPCQGLQGDQCAIVPDSLYQPESHELAQFCNGDHKTCPRFQQASTAQALEGAPAVIPTPDVTADLKDASPAEVTPDMDNAPQAAAANTTDAPAEPAEQEETTEEQAEEAEKENKAKKRKAPSSKASSRIRKLIQEGKEEAEDDETEE